MLKTDNHSMHHPIHLRRKSRARTFVPRAAFFVWLLTILLAFAGIPVANGQTQATSALAAAKADASQSKSPWERIVMVGASATAGFTMSEPFGGTNTAQYRLNRYVEAALLAPHEPVTNLASALFFLQPEAAGRSQIDLALKLKPTLVVGVDFPFWFCYGDVRTNEGRVQRFEKGLRLLENIPCRLVLGDIPDASAAANGILSASQIPSIEVMVAANRRLKEWAAARPQVVVFPLASFMRAAMANQALTVHGNILPAGETRMLLQDDKLHPSASGCAALAVAVLDVVQSKEPAPSTAGVRWDPKEVFRQVAK